RAPHLGDRMEVAERQLLAREGDVDDLLAEAPVELLVGERALALGDRRLEPAAHAVEELAGLPVPYLAQRERELALATEHARAHAAAAGWAGAGVCCACSSQWVFRPPRSGPAVGRGPGGERGGRAGGPAPPLPAGGGENTNRLARPFTTRQHPRRVPLRPDRA